MQYWAGGGVRGLMWGEVRLTGMKTEPHWTAGDRRIGGTKVKVTKQPYMSKDAVFLYNTILLNQAAAFVN